MQTFRLLTDQVKFHQICTLLKVYQVSAKKSIEEIPKSLMIPKSGGKFDEKLFFCFKNDKNLVKSNKFAF